jgi:UDP-3-O-[3-hydroxymyristoyl] N-acetylglucosamine deacetylase
MADRTAWRIVEGETVRRPRAQPEIGRGIVPGRIAAAYGPDVS